MAVPLRWKIGEVTITRIVELESRSIGGFVLPQATPEAIADIGWLRPHFLTEDGRLLLSIHALLVETPERRILVDTCVGNDKERTYRAWSQRSGPFLDELERCGAAPESVDTVLCTHLHVDHVGWNTRWIDGRWVATFSRARYLFGRQEWEYWQDRPDEAGPVIDDSVRPIIDGGLADLVESDHRICNEVALAPTPGHTPGHVSVYVESGGERAVITGDLIHHPCQMVHPEWSASVDFDQDQSRRTRTEFLANCADQPILVIGTHFAGPTAGRVVRDGDAYRLDF